MDYFSEFLFVLFVVLCFIGGVFFVDPCDLFGPCNHLGQDGVFCTKCGEQLLIICPVCDHACNKSYDYCPECGYCFSDED